jgi:cephalosporin-C deacetylase-like acetyl esterase
MVDDYLTAVARGYWEERTRQISQLKTAADIRQRQTWARAKFIELLGGFPDRTPLNPRITGTLLRDGYRIEKLIFESLPAFYVTANVYVPTSGTGPFPAVLGTAGHSGPGKAQWNYQRAWISLARRGFVVLAFDPPGQGERVQYYDADLGRSRVGIATAEHTMAGLQCILTGTNIARYVIWDGIRAFDYLATRKDVDATRVAAIGNSGGGMLSAYLAITEPRLAVAAPSCFMTSSEKLWEDPGPQDAEQNIVHFISSGLGLADYALVFAPRPFLFLTATQDFFPIAGAHAAFAETRNVYGLLDHPDRVDLFEYNDTHSWSKPRREATYRWLQKWLNNRTEDGVEGDFEVEPESVLRCTPTGQLATSLGGETVQSINAALAERLASGRKALDPERSRALAADRLDIGSAGTSPVPQCSSVGEVARPGYRIEKIILDTEKGIHVPALVFVPLSGRERYPATLYLNSEGKSADASDEGEVTALVRLGNIVVAPDLRGWGESANRIRPGPHNGTYQTAMRALLVGKTMLGMQVTDLLATYEYAASRSDVNPAGISVFGKGNGGVAGLFAAALEPRISKTVCEGCLLSYLAMARAKYHHNLVELVLPGVLRDFDLPDVAASIAPRTLWIVDPRKPSDAPESQETARSEYARAFASYDRAGAAKAFRILERPEGWSFEKVYRDWLAIRAP